MQFKRAVKTFKHFLRKLTLPVLIVLMLIYIGCYLTTYSHAENICGSHEKKVSEVTWKLRGYCDMGDHSASINFYGG